MNKLSLIALSLFSISFSYALETVKVFDGTERTCESEKDIFLNRNGAYRAKALKSEMNDQQVELTVKFEFLTCAKTDEGYKFVQIDPYSNTEYKIHALDGEIQTVNVLPINGYLKAYQDGVFKLIDRKELAFKAVQNHVVQIDLKDLKQKPSIDLAVSKEVILDSVDTQIIDTIRYGAFRVHFDVKETGASLKEVK
ncbi:hypothetical protein [Halobacteriovorax sp. HLS]|uniref:hypothetical protein n=1 Tax=Halobacteriovorax sp. HLS TaxID=2234000 RepID=UPI000FDCB6F6|nr:hypothetical protein [Halobacteriovorax sp. HLS]